MKIGPFSKQHHVTIDTIRHYIDLGLLLPQKQGGQYHFTDKDNHDLMEILELKNMNFTLQEIQFLLSYKRLSTLSSSEEKLRYKEILEDKKSSLYKKQRELEKSIAFLQSKIDDIDVNPGIDEKITLGIPLTFIYHLCCPLCSSPLNLMDGLIENNILIHGTFSCPCHYAAEIRNGIYISLTQEDKTKVVPITGAETLYEYVENTPSGYINFMLKSIHMAIQALVENNMHGKIILEAGSGSGFFLKQFLRHLSKDTMYILCDHDIDRLISIKSYLEQHSLHRNFIFLCTDLGKLPIRDHTVHYLIDFWGSFSYHANSNCFLPDLLSRKVNKHGKLLGVYPFPEKNSGLLKKIPKDNRRFYDKDNLLHMFQQSSFKTLKYEDLGYTEEAGEYELFLKGYRIYGFFLLGEREDS